MKPQLLLPLLLAALLPMTASAQSGEGEFPDLFNTSAAYDILAVFPQADKLAEDPFFTGTLGADTLFLDRAHRIDSGSNEAKNSTTCSGSSLLPPLKL